MSKKKKEKELDPQIEEVTFSKNEIDELKDIGKSLSDNSFSVSGSESDTFYKQVVDKLFDTDNIETKTEYLNVHENFMGVKLTFMGRFGNIPLLLNFVNTFEKKRVSLERKGRQEIILALQERRKELEEMNKKSMMDRFM